MVGKASSERELALSWWFGGEELEEMAVAGQRVRSVLKTPDRGLAPNGKSRTGAGSSTVSKAEAQSQALL